MDKINSFDLFNDNTVCDIRNRMDRNKHKALLPGEVLELIYQEKLFKLFVPDQLNGSMTPLPEALKIFEECAFVDGSFGWAVCIGAGGGYFTGYIDKTLAAGLFARNKCVIAGSGAPSGLAVRSGAGYEVTGRWNYCSGADYATMFTVNGLIHDEKNPVKSFVIMPDELEIIKDWNAYGLKATAGHSIKINRLFVPEERVFDLGKPTDDYGYPIYSFPFLLFARFSFAAVVLGLWRHFIEKAGFVVNEAESRWTHENPRRYAMVKSLVDEEAETVKEAADMFFETAAGTWDNFCKVRNLTEQIQQKDGEFCCRLAEIAYDSTAKIFYHLGMEAVMEGNPVNRIWRDMTTAVQHILLKNY